MEKLKLRQGNWAGWLEAPAAPGFAASPILITAVTPLKTGKGYLNLEFVQPLAKQHARGRTLIVRVLQHTASHLTCVFEVDGDAVTAVIMEPSFEWLATYAPVLLHRRPPSSCELLIDGNPLYEVTAELHYQSTFGKTAAQVLSGATRGSFGSRLLPLPASYALLSVDVTYDPFDSWLIHRGFVPSVMEEKWFIYWEDNYLYFRRSWTGVLVYRVEANWRGDSLYLGQLRQIETRVNTAKPTTHTIGRCFCGL